MIINRAIIAGNAGKDVEIKTVGNNLKMAILSICVTEKGRDGAKDRSTWFSVKAFGKTAEAAETIKKGMNVYVEGKFHNEEYEAKDGSKKRDMSIMANIIAIIHYTGPNPIQDLKQIAQNASIVMKPAYSQAPMFDQSQLDDIPF